MAPSPARAQPVATASTHLSDQEEPYQVAQDCNSQDEELSPPAPP